MCPARASCAWPANGAEVWVTALAEEMRSTSYILQVERMLGESSAIALSAIEKVCEKAGDGMLPTGSVLKEPASIPMESQGHLNPTHYGALEASAVRQPHSSFLLRQQHFFSLAIHGIDGVRGTGVEAQATRFQAARRVELKRRR